MTTTNKKNASFEIGPIINVSDATTTQLNWMVTRANYPKADMSATHVWHDTGDGEEDFLIEESSTDWSIGGPLFSEAGIASGLVPSADDVPKEWCAHSYRDANFCRETKRSYGDTELTAKARCYVKQRLGDEVMIPSELT